MDHSETAQFAMHGVNQLRPHPSYVKHQLSVPTFKIAALAQLGDLALLDPIIVTRDRLIIDGYARWELAKSRQIVNIRCLEHALTEDEALFYLLRKQRRSDGLNDFTRVELALDLEPFFREKARSNQQAGGRGKGSSRLTAAERVDSRKGVAKVAGVSIGNVTKVKRILTHACLSIRQAARCGEVSINLAEKWSHEPLAQQLETLRLRQIHRGIRRKARDLVMAHIRQLSQSKPDKYAFNMSDLLGLVRRLSALSADESGDLGPVAIGSVSVPGKGVFVTEELLQALRPQQGVLGK